MIQDNVHPDKHYKALSCINSSARGKLFEHEKGHCISNKVDRSEGFMSSNSKITFKIRIMAFMLQVSVSNVALTLSFEF